jgi:hypothetical protein
MLMAARKHLQAQRSNSGLRYFFRRGGSLSMGRRRWLRFIAPNIPQMPSSFWRKVMTRVLYCDGCGYAVDGMDWKTPSGWTAKRVVFAGKQQWFHLCDECQEGSGMDFEEAVRRKENEIAL